MRRIILIAVLALVVALSLVPGAFAGQQTKIAYVSQGYKVYEYVPAASGYVQATLTWWWPGSPSSRPVFPEAEVNGVVQTDNGSEPYWDVDIGALYSGSNPEIGSWAVTAGVPIYISVVGYAGDVNYELKLESSSKQNGPWTPVATYTGAATGANGEAYIPNSGTWFSVLQQWAGTLPTNIWANWDDYVEAKPPDRQSSLAYNYSIEWVSGVASEVAVTAALADKTWVVAPQIWNSSLNPAVWNLEGDTYPKPGDLTNTQAPVWYTYSFPVDAKAQAPAYFFGTVNNAASSMRTFSMESNVKASITTEFYGTSVAWKYTKAPKGGVAKVLIDGAPPAQNPTVDQYAAALDTAGLTTWTGLADGPHTITVGSNSTKNPASGGLYLYHDAFVAKGNATDTTLSAENNHDGFTTYAWGKVSPPAGPTNPSGGSYSMESSVGAATAFTFSGTEVTWKYTKAPKGGVARVYIDGVDKGTVDLYSATLTYQATAPFPNLSPGWHTILIKNNNTKNPASGGLYLYSDAFVVGATTYED